ncbi:MAG TPA: hypothetical protein VNX86_03850 [Rhizomicrobium sp.]|nr:hypothetical protein [Rhizomicrobium sp.]
MRGREVAARVSPRKAAALCLALCETIDRYRDAAWQAVESSAGNMALIAQ